jgi:hypothetical protein
VCADPAGDARPFPIANCAQDGEEQTPDVAVNRAAAQVEHREIDLAVLEVL